MMLLFRVNARTLLRKENLKMFKTTWEIFTMFLTSLDSDMHKI